MDSIESFNGLYAINGMEWSWMEFDEQMNREDQIQSIVITGTRFDGDQ